MSVDTLAHVISAAYRLTGDLQRAEFLVRHEPLTAFEGKTAESLVHEGREVDVIAYLKSLESGAAG
ncbi:hypothetical protein [Achromobacter kerstersii]